jgi:EAL domain-containing protein (putative c-di-GMP-specific phosphodiesterase class I)
MAVVVALHRLLSGGAFDRAEMMLGTFAAIAVGVRQTLAARAVAAPTPLEPPEPAADPNPGPTPAQAPETARADDPFRRAYLDPVTGLSNHDHLALAVTGLRAVPRCGGALLVVGTDASGGHDRLRDAAERLRRCCRPVGGRTGDLLGRLSDTEFAVLTLNDLAQAYGLAHRILAALGPDASVGITDLADAESTMDVLWRARLAADRARETGPGRVEWYDPGMEQAVRLRETVASELPDALRSGELDLIYQPIMDLARDRPLAVEALLRWRHPRLGTLMPAEVIPAAEQTGLIGDVGRWVLRQASTQLATWRAEGRDLSMSINVSPHGLNAAELVADVTTALSDQRLPADSLILEFAERTIEEIDNLNESFGALRNIGVRTALDAFGTGATSLAHLRRLPVDVVKLHRSFFASAGPDGAAGAVPVLDGLVGMGRRLGVDVVAHGVELPDELEVLRQTRCPFGQGHVFAPPQPVERTEAYLDGFAQ